MCVCVCVCVCVYVCVYHVGHGKHFEWWCCFEKIERKKEKDKTSKEENRASISDAVTLVFAIEMRREKERKRRDTN